MITGGVLGYLIELIFDFIELILGLRIVLKLFGANASAPFTNWIYETTRPLIAPFQGMFPSPVISGGFVIEFSTIFALLIYGFIAFAAHESVEFVNFTTRKYYSVKDKKHTQSE